MPRILNQYAVDQVYITLPVTAYPRIINMMNSLQETSVEMKMIPDVLQYIALKARMEDFDGIPVVTLNTTPMSGWQGAIKRILDLIISLAALILTSCLWGIIAVAIKINSKGPIFYKQERMGLDGQSFQIYKFRSMYQNAEKESGPVWAKKNDERRTHVGKILRYLSLDELPQLINVLKGEMSLVGPRPERPELVKIFRDRIPKYMLRHKVKAGLTGLAQINGFRGNTSLEKRVEFDIRYIENWSIFLDLKIILKTLLRVTKNAY
jgi:Undecaprenyl-phosphate glucose phosphotransferase